jgi:hypothetical protein
VSDLNGRDDGNGLEEAARQWAAAFNGVHPDDVELLVAEAAIDEWFDHRTNLFLMGRRHPTDVALVLSDPLREPDDCLLVRWNGSAWIVDADPVDWDDLEDDDFDDDPFDDDDPIDDHPFDALDHVDLRAPRGSRGSRDSRGPRDPRED